MVAWTLLLCSTTNRRGIRFPISLPRQPHPQQFPLLCSKSAAFVPKHYDFQCAVFYDRGWVFFLAVFGPPHLQRTHHVSPKGREALHPRTTSCPWFLQPSWTGLDQADSVWVWPTRHPMTSLRDEFDGEAWAIVSVIGQSHYNQSIVVYMCDIDIYSIFMLHVLYLCMDMLERARDSPDHKRKPLI